METGYEHEGFSSSQQNTFLFLSCFCSSFLSTSLPIAAIRFGYKCREENLLLKMDGPKIESSGEWHNVDNRLNIGAELS